MTWLVGSFSVDRLARRALLEGAASALDVRGDTQRQYRFSESVDAADCRALADDWLTVGQDFSSAMQSRVASREHVSR